MAPKTTFICPYCFEKHKLTEIQFRCTNRRCKDFDDIEMTQYENGNLKMPKQGKRTFSVPSLNVFSVPKSAKCPECGSVTHKYICPSCHNELPESTLTGKDIIISIVGSRATGKSHFVGVIIKELRDRISVSFGGSFEGFADSYRRWEDNFGIKLYIMVRTVHLFLSLKSNIKLDLKTSLRALPLFFLILQVKILTMKIQ